MDTLAVNPTVNPAIQSLHIIERAQKLFERVRHAGTQRDKARNREFLYSHYAALVLLSVFNPLLQTLRGLQEATQLKAVQRRLGVGRVSLGSLSESCRVFDPDLLLPLIEDLLADSSSGPGPRRHIPDTIPDALARRLVAADGSVLQALPQIARGGRDWRLHLQFRTWAGVPQSVALERDGDVDERDVLTQHLEANCVYLADRGYERYALLNRIVAAKSDYVIRSRERPFAFVAARPLTATARTARVIADEIVRLSPTTNTTRAETPTHPVRRIVLAGRDRGRVRADRPPTDELILLTNLVDVPAEVVAAVYEMRWSIELFFRFLKQMMGCRRLFSNKAEAVAIQVYCALIACLLLAQMLERPVTMTIYRLFGFYLQGLADEAELDAGLARALQKER
jgi:hypothetical protein